MVGPTLPHRRCFSTPLAGCYACSMSAAPVPSSPHEPRHIPQRELRNESSKILREVEKGAEFIITNRGRPVARLTGLKNVHSPRLAYTPASRPLRLGAENRIQLPISTKEILDTVREERL